MNALMNHDLIDLHRQELLRQAEQARLASSISTTQRQTGTGQLILAEIGRQMVNLGQRLQAGQEVQPRLQPEG